MLFSAGLCSYLRFLFVSQPTKEKEKVINLYDQNMCEGTNTYKLCMIYYLLMASTMHVNCSRIGFDILSLELMKPETLIIIYYSKQLKEHVDIMIFIECYPLKRCQGCVKLIASKVNCFLNINELSEVQLCMSSNSWT